MYIEIDVEKSIAKSIQEALSGDLIKTAIEERVNKLIKSVVDEETGPYSDFGRLIQREIKEALPMTYSMENRSNFQDAILKIIEKNISAYQDKNLENRINELMSGLLKKAPEKIKISELVAQAAKMWEVSRPSVHVEVSAGLVSGYVHLYLDKERDKGKYSCSCSIAISDKGNVYSIKVFGQDLRDSLFVGPFYEFERFLFWLYTGGTIVEVDRTDFSDLYLPEYDEDE